MRLFQKTVLQRMRREVGIMSIVDDLAGEELRTRLTSAAVTGYSMSSTGP